MRIGEHTRDALKKLADANYNNDGDKKVEGMTLKELSENEYLKVKSIINGAHIQPLAKEIRAHKARDGDIPGPMNGVLTCSLSLILRSRTEKEIMRTFAKSAGFLVKHQVPKILIQQKKDVDQYFRTMSDIKEWWIKVDVLKGRETDNPKFRVGRKRAGSKWDNKWHIEIKDPSIWGRLTAEQKKEHLEKETQATTIGGDIQ